MEQNFELLFIFFLVYSISILVIQIYILEEHSILTFVRIIFPGVWEESVMRHGGQASDEIEDDLYQYNII